MFSYNEYKNIINLVGQHLNFVDFADVDKNTDNFCILRHDIEYSIDRALDMARFEADELGVTSTYCVQLRSNIYNAISNKNIDVMTEIKSLGHKIALHINPPLMDISDVREYISNDIKTLERHYEFEIDRFSFHIPKKEYLKPYIQIDNKINCYDRLFFHYFDEKKPKKLKVIYLADSNHQWKYGHPLDFDFSKMKKLQLLTHPYSWTRNGFDNFKNISNLIKERTHELALSMSEIKSFPRELLETLKHE
jgi:hypothetical protein